MNTTIDANKLIADINQKLPIEQQIRKDDPMYSAVVLNTVVLDTYLRHLNQNLDQTLLRLSTISDQQVERAEAITQKMLLNTGDTIAKQLDTAIQRGEERLKKTAAETDGKIRWASRFAWIGAALLNIVACCFIGDWLGNTILDMTHMQKSTHKQDNQRNSSPRKTLR